MLGRRWSQWPREDLSDLRREARAILDYPPLTPIRIFSASRRVELRRSCLNTDRSPKVKTKRALTIRKHENATEIRVDTGARQWRIRARDLKRGVYVVVCSDRIKIGKSTNVAARFRDLRAMNGADIALMGWFPGEYTERESALHLALADDRLHGEWFRLTAAVLAFIHRQPGFEPNNSEASKSRHRARRFA